MVLTLIALSDRNLKRLLGDPPLVYRVIHPEDDALYRKVRSDFNRKGFRSRLLVMKAEGAEDPDSKLHYSEGEGAAADLDKTWHGLHYLFTKTAWKGKPPLDFLMNGGEPVGTIDLGFGPARVFYHRDAKAIHEAISRIYEDELREKFNPKEMSEKDIYPQIWDGSGKGENPLDYLMKYLAVLRGFLEKTAGGNLGFMVYLSQAGESGSD